MPTWHEGTELAKALAPTIVAGAVLVVTASQNRWQRRHSTKQQLIDSRAHQLALLSRRLDVLKTVTGVVGRYSVDRGSHDGKNDQLFPILLEGKVLFSAEIGQQLQEAWLIQVAFHERRLDTTTVEAITDQVLRATILAERDKLRTDLFERARRIQRQMIAATRIDEDPTSLPRIPLENTA